MKFDSPSVRLIAILVCCDILMRVIVGIYYSDHRRILRILHLGPRAGARGSYYRRFDAWLAPLPFLWAWLEIAACVLAADMVRTPAAWLLAMIAIGGRFRALQEFGHNAVHYALCRSRGWQWLLADFFYQFPAFKRDMHSREITHTQEHHRNPNHASRDPNRARVRAGGLVAPLSSSGFLLCLLYPLRPAVVWTNLLAMYQQSTLNINRTTVVLRLLSLVTFLLVFYGMAGWRGILFGWLLPLLTTYQLFVWLSLLTEHRWFVEGAVPRRLELEYLVGRPTDYRGISGWLVRVLVSPTSDAYHLAHSLYPGLRWNYLPAIDRYLKINDPRYTENASEGLLICSHGMPSALSELRERLSDVSNTGSARLNEGTSP
jgi:fatty acid desaturase